MAGSFLLRYPADRRTLGFAASWFGLVALQWVVTPTQPWIAVPLYVSTCVLSFVGAVSTHNVIHAPMFARTSLNDAWRLVQTLWYGQPVSLFVPVHNHSHHKHAQTRRDLTRSTKVTGTWQLSNMVRATQWGRAAARDCRAYMAEQRRRGKRIWFQLRAEVVVLVVVYALLLALDWQRFLTFVLLPHQFGAFCIKAINYLQHDGCDYDLRGYDHSRNFTGRVFNWFLLNNGYHTVHHMRPGLHWSVLPERHAQLVQAHIHPDLDVPSFWPWFWRAVVWPGERLRYDGAPFAWPPGGEGEDEPWNYSLEAAYQAEPRPEEERRRAS